MGAQAIDTVLRVHRTLYTRGDTAGVLFCGKSKVRSLIEAGCSRDPDAPQNCVFICDECVALCAQVNADFIGHVPNSESLALP